MKLAIMQPYFLPYIGYYQLIASVDVFVVYDNIKYTKKGWINRNRMLQNNRDVTFSLPMKKDSDALAVGERELAVEFDQRRLLRQFEGAYRRAPYFNETFEMLEKIVLHQDRNLFGYLYHALNVTCSHLAIRTELRVSSSIAIDHGLKGQDKVIALCRASEAATYINSIGGVNLYSKDDFRMNGIALEFLKPRSLEYPQFGADFVPWLSIVDVLMFLPVDAVSKLIATNYELI